MTVLDSFAAVDSALSHYQDLSALRSSGRFDGSGGSSDPSRFPFPPALLDRLEERTELGWRVRMLSGEEQEVVARWYFGGERPEAIAHAIGRSVRHVYRVRIRAVGRLVDFGQDDEFADADVAEFAQLTASVPEAPLTDAPARPDWAVGDNSAPRSFEPVEPPDSAAVGTDRAGTTSAGDRGRSPARTRARRRRRWRHRRRVVGRFVGRHAAVIVPIVVGLALAAVWSLAAIRSADTELARARDAMLSARTSLGVADADAATAALDRAETHLTDARRAVSRSPLGVLRPVPVFGSPAKAVDAVDRSGNSVIAAARTLAGAVESFPTSGAVGVDGKDLAPFRAAAITSAGALDLARADLDDAIAALDGPSGALLPMISAPARDLAGDLRAAEGQLDGAERGLTLLADLAAPTTDARILVLSQDTMELRATGGFIGTFGVIHFDHGTVRLEDFDNFDVLPPPDPPMEAPDTRLGNGPWTLANVNWSPDFPTTAATAKEMFKRQGRGEVAGVLAITEEMMAELVGVLGPIQVPGYDEPVVEEGFAERALYEVELKRPLDTPKKRFLIELSRIVFNRLFALEGADLPGVVDVFSRAGGDGGAQLWFADDQRQSQLGDAALVGAVPDPDGNDFLMVVDTNLSAGKANADLVRTIDYEVRERDGRLHAAVTVSFRNDGIQTAVNPYYAGYVRLLVPPDSELVAGGDAYDDGAADELGYKVLGGSVYVSPNGGQDSLVFEYRLPDSIGDGYQLRWLRQAGTRADVLRATVGGARTNFPAEARVLSIQDPNP